MEFKIIVGNSVDDFNEKVRAEMAIGFRPAGAHQVSFDNENQMYISQQYMKLAHGNGVLPNTIQQHPFIN